MGTPTSPTSPASADSRSAWTRPTTLRVTRTPPRPSAPITFPTAQQAANQIGQGFKIDQDGHIDQTVQNLLLAPITSVSAVLKPGPVSGAGLCAQMRPLQSKFPFSPQATAEATPQDLGGGF